MQKLPIPPPYTGHKKNVGTTAILKKLEIGDSVVLPMRAKNSVHACAMSARIKITIRNLGSKTHFTVWRVE